MLLGNTFSPHLSWRPLGIISEEIVAGVQEEEGTEQCGWRRQRWELRKPTASAELERGQMGLPEGGGDLRSFPWGSRRESLVAHPGGGGLQIPVLEATAKVIKPTCATEH